MNLIVIGAGLAGAACAHALAARGCQVTVLSHGGGASELPVGLLAAHLSPQDIELSQFSRNGVQHTLSQARMLLREGIDWQPCELRQKLLFHPEKNARLRQGAARLPDWYEVHDEHVLHKIAAWIKPQALAQACLKQPGVRLQEARVTALRRDGTHWQALDAQAQLIARAEGVVIAAGAQADGLLAACGHPLTMDNVSGSVALGAWPGEPPLEPQLINGNGHFIGGVAQDAHSHFWLSGSTYERELGISAQQLETAGRQANQERLAKLMPADLLVRINAQFVNNQVQTWQGQRCTTTDRFPIVGELESGLHVCTAMGSRGLSFAALCADILAREVMQDGSPPIISAELRRELLPSRKALKVSSP